jgi:hypothetical protein
MRSSFEERTYTEASGWDSFFWRWDACAMKAAAGVTPAGQPPGRRRYSHPFGACSTQFLATHSLRCGLHSPLRGWGLGDARGVHERVAPGTMVWRARFLLFPLISGVSTLLLLFLLYCSCFLCSVFRTRVNSGLTMARYLVT